GMIAGAYIEEYLGWRAMFHIAFALSVLMLLLAWASIYSPPPASSERIDFASTTLLAGATALMLIYLTEAPYRGWLTPVQAALLAAGFALFGGFIVYGSMSSRVIIRLSLLKRRNVMVANVIGLLSGLTMFLLFMGVIYYSEEVPPYGLGLTVISAAITLLPATLAMVFIAPLVGSATSTLGPKPVLVYGSLVSALGFYLFTVDRATPTALVLDSFITGVGVVSIMIPIVNMVAVSMPQDSVSVGLGFNTMVRFLGASAGPVLAATLMTDYKAYVEYLLPGRSGLFFAEAGPTAFNLIFYIGSITSVIMAFIAAFSVNYRAARERDHYYNRRLGQKK
ncbi:MAG: MFS transporter, partial [Acidilobus sp.]